MLFLINGRDAGEWEFDNTLENHCEHIAKIELNEMLDNIYGDLCIENCTIFASEIFAQCRPDEYAKMLRERIFQVEFEARMKTRRGDKVEMLGDTFEITIGDED